MIRRLMPFIITLLAMLLDTAVIPVFYHGTFTVPLTIVVVMCISLSNGRLRGLLFGMIGGLLIDITAGSLGIMTFFFMIAGFLIGLLIDEKNDRPIRGAAFHLRRGIVAFALFMLGEIFFAVYSYFMTASFEWVQLRNMAIRSAIVAVLTMLLCPLLKRIFVSKDNNSGDNREVKHF